MNYKNMTDAQINEAVTNLVARNLINELGIVDYCNDWAYGGLIIQSAKITVIDLGDEYMAVHGFQLNDDKYRDNVADWSSEARDKKPLRAAMIVYLMMGEEK